MPDAPTGDDRDLVAALRAGDEQAFAALIDGWSGSMLRMARLHVPTDSVAEEVVQDTWLAVLTGLDRFRGESSLRTWVYRILLNQAKTKGVARATYGPVREPDRRRRRVGGRADRGPEPVPGRRRPAPGWLAAVPRRVARAVRCSRARSTRSWPARWRTLPPRQRAVVALRDLDGHTAEEVSELLMITPGNQRVLLHRGRAVVRAHLEHYYDPPPRSAARRCRRELRDLRRAGDRLPRGPASRRRAGRLRGAPAPLPGLRHLPRPVPHAPSRCSGSCPSETISPAARTSLLDAFAGWRDRA